MKKANPFISIIIPTYNRAEYLLNAIDSCRNQTDGDFEVVIVNDGGNQAISDNLSNYNDERIKYIYIPKAGRSSARNVGIDNSNGKFIAFLDDDDFYKTDFIKNIKEFIEINQISSGVIFHSIEIKEETGTRIFSFDTSSEILPQVWIHGASPIMYCLSRDIITKHRFSEDIDYAEDLFFIIKILLEFNSVYISNFMNGVYLKHNESTIAKASKKEFKKSIKDFDHVALILEMKYNLKVTLGPSIFNQKIISTRKNFIKKALNNGWFFIAFIQLFRVIPLIFKD